jgi:tRNA A-37 threonylcarbamoyl transferase component Bud32
MAALTSLQLRDGHPDFLDLPWELPLSRWGERCSRLVQMERGLSRHDVLFVSYGRAVYALKELTARTAQREYEVLRGLEERGLPAVTAVGLARVRPDGADEENGVLITRFLESSLPYRSLFMQPGLERYRERLLDAVAVLLVRLHLGGLFWGDCSLSNALFRRDAGELQAYLVDAETSELHESISDGMRLYDLEIMEENVAGGLADLAAVVTLPAALDVMDTGRRIRRRYEQLWGEITRELTVVQGDGFAIQERIRALNALGFSVGEVELVPSGDGNRLRMRTVITDRDYHHHMLHTLTGINAEERQATLLLGELQSLQATLSTEQDRSVPLSVTAYRWLHDLYLPAVEALRLQVQVPDDSSELYCQVLEHKWFLSEREKRDVGHQRALEDYLELKRARGELAPEAPLGGSS